MIFTSYTYLVFVLGAFLVHWSLPASRRNVLLLLASYAFYCSWAWQYGFLLLGASLFNWAWGRFVLPDAKSSKPLVVGILVNLVPLGYFKYTGFMVDNGSAVANLLGVNWHPALPEILLPLGISFFTFAGIAYLVDVAAGEPPFARLSEFLLFNGFWPKLIAGPIVRADEIREPILGARTLDVADLSAGSWRILSGFFKKVVLADTLAPIADLAYLRGSSPNAMDGVFGTLAFGLQIYFDFSGYSDIAIGTARLFGFRFPENFDWPYLARSPQEFWNRWHKTLSRWIRDYVFTPLTFAARRSPRSGPLWLVVAMAACGLWHGAQWTFVLWGIWHGLLLVLNQTLLARFFQAPTAGAPPARFRVWTATVVTFAAVSAGWILFRAQSVSQAWDILSGILTLRGGLRPGVLRENAILVVAVIFLGLVVGQFLRGSLGKWKERSPRIGSVARVLEPAFYVLLILAVFVFDKEASAFVYFQF